MIRWDPNSMRAHLPPWTSCGNGPLQWGRALSCAEISNHRRRIHRRDRIFNGAAHSRARKFGTAFPDRDPERTPFQWGRALSCAEIVSTPVGGVPPTGVFNGAAHSRARKFFNGAVEFAAVLAFQWGRALSCAEILHGVGDEA